LTPSNVSPSALPEHSLENPDFGYRELQLSIVIPVLYENLKLQMLLKFLKAMIQFPCEILVLCQADDVKVKALVSSLQNETFVFRTVDKAVDSSVVDALNRGFEAALGKIVLIYAADEVGPLLAIKDMLELFDDGCEFVSGTRYAHGGRRLGSSFLRHSLSKLTNKFLGVFGGAALTDVTSGIKMLPRLVYKRLELSPKPLAWNVAIEMSIKAQLLGLKMGEVPIISVDFLYGGESKVKLISFISEYLRWSLWALFTLLQTKEKTRRADVVVKRSSVSTSLR
jgi:hypothetical protein